MRGVVFVLPSRMMSSERDGKYPKSSWTIVEQKV